MHPAMNILLLCGSATENSSNHKLLEHISESLKPPFHCTFSGNLKSLPHFDPALSNENTPAAVVDFRKNIADADGIIICTPEYVFSIPSALKNLIEWCVATTLFTDKPVGLITASASGHKGHEELQLLMRTFGAKFIPETTLLISGIKAKVNDEGELKSAADAQELQGFLEAFRTLVAAAPTAQSSSR